MDMIDKVTTPIQIAIGEVSELNQNVNLKSSEQMMMMKTDKSVNESNNPTDTTDSSLELSDFQKRVLQNSPIRAGEDHSQGELEEEKSSEDNCDNVKKLDVVVKIKTQEMLQNDNNITAHQLEEMKVEDGGEQVNEEQMIANNNHQEQDEMEEEEDNDDRDSCENGNVVKDKSPPSYENNTNEESSALGRNRRVRQKNRYFLDFHCIDLTKVARSSKDDFDNITSTGTRSSNRRSNQTETKQSSSLGPDSFEYKFCRKCSNKTAHEIDGACQACLYKKIVESHKRQKPASQRGRAAPKQKQLKRDTSNVNSNINRNINNGIESSSSTAVSSAPPNNATNTIITTSPTDETNVINSATVSVNATNASNDVPKLDTWSPEDVSEFISSKGFQSEAEFFKTEMVDGISLLLMQRNDFTHGLKIKLGPALKIYDQVCKLKEEYFQTITSTQ